MGGNIATGYQQHKSSLVYLAENVSWIKVFAPKVSTSFFGRSLPCNFLFFVQNYLIRLYHVLPHINNIFHLVCLSVSCSLFIVNLTIFHHKIISSIGLLPLLVLTYSRHYFPGIKIENIKTSKGTTREWCEIQRIYKQRSLSCI